MQGVEGQHKTAGNSSARSALPDTGLAAFSLLAKFLRVAVDADQLLHERGRGNDPFSVQDMLRAARQLKINARAKSATLDRLVRQPLPAIARGADGRFFILARIEERHGELRALVQRPDGEGAPEIWNAETLAAEYAGELVLMTTREQLAGGARKFDVTWFIPALVKYRKALRDVLAASFVIQLVALATPIFFQLVIDKVLVHQSMTTLTVLAIGFAVISLWEVMLSGLRTWLFAHTTNRVDAELGAQLFRHLLNLPLAYFESRRVGDSVARVRELETIRDFLTNSSVTLVIDLLFTFVFLGVMLLYSPLLTLIVAISIPVYVGISAAITPPLRRRLEEKFSRGAENQAFLVESVTGVQTLKAMAVEPQMRAHWERQIAGYTKTGFDVVRLANWGSQAVQLTSKLTTVAILYFGAKAVIAGDLSVGALVAFNMLAGRVSQPVLRLAQMWQDFQRVSVSVERLGDVLNAPAEPAHNPGRASLPKIKGAVIFDQVRFRYRPDAPEVLRGVSLDIKPGEMLGIVGPSGSGKSTLTKLVQRLYVPTQGRVLVDGVDLALVDPAWLRRQVGVVLQENLLFNRSVRENIALADPTLPQERIMAAAEAAGAHEFILELPEGYDTLIDERGGNLSGGQRQRIAIARALITNPRILILDEATSALDAESEEIVQKNLKLIAHGRTVIIIAHRLSAVRQCDRIITLEKGEITEEGDHDALLECGGRYAKMYRRQMGMGQ
jgi:subfamily B ATP-binding cassette protein HlyB/CyaB